MYGILYAKITVLRLIRIDRVGQGFYQSDLVLPCAIMSGKDLPQFVEAKMIE